VPKQRGDYLPMFWRLDPSLLNRSSVLFAPVLYGGEQRLALHLSAFVTYNTVRGGGGGGWGGAGSQISL
jgi:hypothetical protein